MQLDFASSSLLGNKPGARAPVENGLGAFPVDSRIDIRRFRLKTIVPLGKEWGVRNETDFNTILGTAQLMDLYGYYQFGDGHEIRVGQYKAPFGWEGLRTSRGINTIARSDVTVALYQERDFGIGLTRDSGNLQYGIAVMDGERRNRTDKNPAKDVFGRISYALLEELRVGGSFHIGTRERNGADLPVRRYGAEFQADLDAVKLEGEFIVGEGPNNLGGGFSESLGYYLTALVPVQENTDLVVSYDRFEPHRREVNNDFADTILNERDRFVLGLNYYFDRETRHRVMLNYELRQSLEGPSADSHGFRFRYQLTF